MVTRYLGVTVLRGWSHVILVLLFSVGQTLSWCYCSPRVKRYLGVTVLRGRSHVILVLLFSVGGHTLSWCYCSPWVTRYLGVTVLRGRSHVILVLLFSVGHTLSRCVSHQRWDRVKPLEEAVPPRSLRALSVC